MAGLEETDIGRDHNKKWEGNVVDSSKLLLFISEHSAVFLCHGLLGTLYSSVGLTVYKLSLWNLCSGTALVLEKEVTSVGQE